MFSKEGYIIPEKKLQQYKSTPAREWQGLNDDVVMQTYLFIFNDDELEPDEQVIQFYKMIEQALKEKNHG